MSEQLLEGDDARTFFEGLWHRRDYWALESSDYDQRRYALQLELLGDRGYSRALELGAGEGAFSRLLASVADEVVAVEIAENAIERARGTVPANVTLRHSDVVEFDVFGEGPWDLIVMTETIYYLGWLHTFYEVAWYASAIFESLRVGGRFLLANTFIQDPHGIMNPWDIKTYRDLFRNVGFELEREETLSGVKGEQEMEALISLFEKRDDLDLWLGGGLTRR